MKQLNQIKGIRYSHIKTEEQCYQNKNSVNDSNRINDIGRAKSHTILPVILKGKLTSFEKLN
jgi:hypothetical protein